MSRSLPFVLTFLLAVPVNGRGPAAAEKRMASQLAEIKADVYPAGEAPASMVGDDIRARKRAFNEAETKAFAKVRTAADWEKFRQKRLAALKRAMGPGALPPADPAGVKWQVTKTLPGEGFKVQNIYIEGRPGLPITANLYLPDPPPKRPGPGILIITSHHNPKWQGECQDMGMTWARSGATVLVTDNLGHGERKQNPYGKREDYRWRYYLGSLLYTVGETLMGWMVADNVKALDLLGSLKEVDPRRVILIGAVAGGGDPSAVLAAFDARVTCSIPFNFGGQAAPKPTEQDPRPIPDLMRWPDWESTRALRGNGPGGYVPWMIVACSAPRRTIFAKEFGWSPVGDVGFANIAKVFKLHGASDKLASMHGYGRGSQSSSEASHCNNVGASHRKAIYPILQKWLKMPVPKEYRKRIKYDDLTCLNFDLRKKLKVRPVHEICAEIAAGKLTAARAALDAAPAEKRKAKLRKDWAAKLGDIEPAAAPKVVKTASADTPDVAVEKLILRTEERIVVPVLLLKPKGLPAGTKCPVVVGVTEGGGKSLFLAKRAGEIAALLSRGVAVCLIDVRGAGETRPDKSRGWWTKLTDRACEELMLGGTMLGGRLRDVRFVLAWLRSRPDLDGRRLAVWGESFAGTNPEGFSDPPMKANRTAAEARPTGALLALLAGLYEDDVRAVVARGGLVSFASVLDGPACHIGLDAVVPDVLAAGDLADVTAALTPRPVRIEAPVTGRNILATPDRLKKEFAPAAGLSVTATESKDVADFLAKALDATRR